MSNLRSKCFAYKNADGGVSIVRPHFSSKRTDQETLAIVMAQDIPHGAEMIELETASLPNSRADRDRWKLTKTGVEVAAR